MSRPQRPRLDAGAQSGLGGATLVGVGAMAGAGIFVLLGATLAATGPGVLLVLAGNGLLALVTAASFAELAATFPESGGGYVFAKKVLPVGGAFGTGWVLWFAYVVAAALYALGFAGFVAFALEAHLGWPRPPWLEPAVALAACAACVWLLVRRGAGPGNGLSIAKLFTFGGLVVLGVLAVARRPIGEWAGEFTPLAPAGVAGLAAGAALTFIAFEGFEVIATIGEEVRDPARTIPRAMFLSVAITLVVYVLLTAVALAAGGPADGTSAWRELSFHDADAMAVAAGRYGGVIGAALVLVAGLLATLSAMLASLLAASRIAFAMARDRALPRALGRVGAGGRAPVQALVWSGLLAAAVVLLSGDVDTAGAAASLVFLIAFTLANAAGLLVRQRAATLSAWRAPWYPLTPLAGIVGCSALALSQLATRPLASAVVLAWIGLGTLFYRTRLRRGALTADALAEAWDENLLALRGRTPRVLVPIAHPERAEPLVSLADALVPSERGRVIGLCVAPARDGVAADEAARDGALAAARAALAAAASLGRPFECDLVLAPDVVTAVARAARERRPETVLLGMADLSAPGGLSLLEEIVAATPADLVVLNAPPNWRPAAVRRLLVPFAGRSPHDPLRARLVGRFQRGGAEAVLLHVTGEGTERARAQRRLAEGADDLGIPRERCRLEATGDPIEAILRHAAEADLVLLGFAAASGRRRLFGRFALEVIARAPCPVIAVARAEGESRSAASGRGG